MRPRYNRGMTTSNKKPKAPNKPFLARRLRELREQRGWTRCRLTRTSGVSNSVVALIEEGRRLDPAWSTVQALARALDVPTDTFREP
jgi:transcriptional regulator with XRE-family HTH domain